MAMLVLPLVGWRKNAVTHCRVRNQPVLAKIIKPKRNQNESESDMDNYTATGLAEGFIEAESEEQVLEAWQHLVDTGLAWQLQGFFGRTAASLIEQGYINAPEVSA